MQCRRFVISLTSILVPGRMPVPSECLRKAPSSGKADLISVPCEGLGLTAEPSPPALGRCPAGRVVVAAALGWGRLIKRNPSCPSRSRVSSGGRAGATGAIQCSSQERRHLAHQSHFVPGRAQFAPGCRSANRRRRSWNGFTMGQGGPCSPQPGGPGPCKIQSWHLLEPRCRDLPPSAGPPPPPAPHRPAGGTALEPATRMQPGLQTWDVAARWGWQAPPPAGGGQPPGYAPRPPVPSPELLCPEPVSTGQPAWSFQKQTGSHHPWLIVFQSLLSGSES